PTDSLRIQRALEVYRVSGKPLSEWHLAARGPHSASNVRFVKLALQTADRTILHRRIEQRLDSMLRNGFLDEVSGLMRRPNLRPDMASMRAVGYRQIWAHLAGACTLEEGRYRALVATRQLAKRQSTWLRSERDLVSFDPLESQCIDAISTFLVQKNRINS
ncbi:MAG: tRNA (adenosine(37)-N6)-dimethylallyltransferase MiaA, partial [Gammaproteobacteria bacterium]|nr:tRNA (adenosine(37)-N6)-dimethylallyltransferase MiaA [Gammaproteobacteria bacterium]